MEIKFNACEHLDYKDNYTLCKRQLLRNGQLFWLRDVSYDPSLPNLVQFCTKRGRLNKAKACLSQENAACSDFNLYEHNINIPKEELES